jgi:hypothetical protein
MEDEHYEESPCVLLERTFRQPVVCVWGRASDHVFGCLIALPWIPVTPPATFIDGCIGGYSLLGSRLLNISFFSPLVH